MSPKDQSASLRSRLRPFLIALFIASVVISHILLPTFNNRQDFLFFFTWDMFSGPVNTRVLDLTWDEGESFLFRDHRRKAKSNNLDLVVLLQQLNYGDLQKLKSVFLPQLLDICECDKIELFSLQGSMFDHIVLKSSLNVSHRESL